MKLGKIINRKVYVNFRNSLWVYVSKDNKIDWLLSRMVTRNTVESSVCNPINNLRRTMLKRNEIR